MSPTTTYRTRMRSKNRLTITSGFGSATATGDTTDDPYKFEAFVYHYDGFGLGAADKNTNTLKGVMLPQAIRVTTSHAIEVDDGSELELEQQQRSRRIDDDDEVHKTLDDFFDRLRQAAD